MPKLILLALLLINASEAFSQYKGFRPGLIVTQHNDTIICLVPIASWFTNKIPIKRTAEAEEEKFPLSQVKYLATESNVFENIAFTKKNGKEVNRLMWMQVEGKLNLYMESMENITSVRKDTKGTMMMYGENITTYVIRKDSKFYLVDQKKFIESISPLIADSPPLLEKLQLKVYTYRSIEDLVKEYNRTAAE